MGFVNRFGNDNRIIILNSNIQSINGKFQELTTLVQLLKQAEINIDIITLQETWEIIDENAFLIPGFKFFHASRKLGKRGGVGVYIKEYLKPSPVPDKSLFIENIFESLVLEMTMPDSSKKTFISTFYRPNSHKTLSNNEQINYFFEALSTFLEALDSKPAYICADANINQHLDNAHSADLNNVLSAYGFFNTITKATRFQNNSATAIDHIYTNIIRESYQTGVITDNISDHMLTFLVIDEKAKKELKSTYVNYR